MRADLPLPAFVNLICAVTVGCGTDAQSPLCNGPLMHMSSFATLAQFPPSPTHGFSTKGTCTQHLSFSPPTPRSSTGFTTIARSLYLTFSHFSDITRPSPRTGRPLFSPYLKLCRYANCIPRPFALPYWISFL